jgi:hypothetical protein
MAGHGYRPITDTWILARPKVKYYGAFPAGFLGRARDLLGVSLMDPVLHVCGGRVRDYPFRGFGPHDRTLDLDPALAPDYLQDARASWPACPDRPDGRWAAVLIDRAYTLEDAARYAPGASALPDLNALLRKGLQAVPVDSRVGVLDYLWPHPGAAGTEVAVVGVGTGRNNRARWFTVFRRLPAKGVPHG